MSGAPSTVAPEVNAHSEPGPRYGIPTEDFYVIWSGQLDRYVNATSYADVVDGELPPIAQLATETDLPMKQPPAAVERWNRNDLERFPETDRNTSVHPPHAELNDGEFIQDAYAAIFAVQPSTRTHQSPDRRPLYVDSSGEVLGTVDYRIRLPPGNESGDKRVSWSVESHRIVETRVSVDGDDETVARGTHTPVVSYSGLDAYPGRTHRLRLAATISVTLQKTIKRCEAHEEGECTSWNETVEYPSEEQTVSDSVRVVTSDPEPSVTVGEYPDGDLEIVVNGTTPWRGYAYGNAYVSGIWRFYTARDSNWDELVVRNATATTTRHSPLHPLQVNAFPSKTGVRGTPSESVSVLEISGRELTAPSLPGGVTLDVVSGQYTTSDGVVARIDTDGFDRSKLAIDGLVRGDAVDLSTEQIETVSIRPSQLDLRVLNTTDERVTVRTRLQDEATGDPINTAERDGYVEVAGQQVNTSGNGTVTTTVARQPGGITAKYEPGPWWRADRAYTATTDTVALGGSGIAIVTILFQLGIPVALFLLAVFLVDRSTGMDIFPPWRRR